MKSIKIIDNRLVSESQSEDDFLNDMSKISNDINFYENIIEYIVQEDELMASVWTPYEFYINNQLIHTGHNLFVLIKNNQKWEISNITDSRISVK